MTARSDSHLLRANVEPAAAAGVSLAPVALLRVAEWPLSTLERLSCPLLWAEAVDGPAGSPLGDAYRAALGDQRAVLADITTTVAFERALALAHPTVGERWRRGGGRARSAKARDRRLEHTVVRFVCRAAGRATPNGAWAGVAPVEDTVAARPGGPIAVEPAEGAWWVAPSVEPFVRLGAWIALSEPYLRSGPFRLDATLHRRDGRWRVLGAKGWRVLPDHPLLSQLVAWWDTQDRGGGLPLAPFVNAVAANPSAAELVWVALGALRDAGVLEAALGIEAAVTDAGAALRAPVSALPDQLRAAWGTAVDSLEAQCAALASSFESLDGGQLAVALAAARAIVDSLGQTVGAPPGWLAPHTAVVRVDRRAPVRATWTAHARARVAAAIDEAIDLWAADGTAERYRRAHLDTLPTGPLLDVLWQWTTASVGSGAAEVATVGAPGPWTRAGIFRAHFAVAADFVVEQSWHGLRGPDGIVVADPARLTGPWSSTRGAVPRAGAHVLTVDGDNVHLEWGRPQPGLFAGRHRQLDVGAATYAAFAAAMAACGLSVVELGLRDIVAHDAALHRPGGAVLHLAERRRVAALEVAADGLVALNEGDGSKRLALATTNSAAASARRDPLSLVGTELINSQGWELLSFPLPLLERELVGGAPLGPVLTLSGNVLRRRRLVVPVEWAQACAALNEAERYRRWARTLAAAGFDGLVSVEVGVNPPLMVPASSPLAVEAVFASIADPPVSFVVADPPPATLVVDHNGEPHAAELAVAWWQSEGATKAPR